MVNFIFTYIQLDANDDEITNPNLPMLTKVKSCELRSSRSYAMRRHNFILRAADNSHKIRNFRTMNILLFDNSIWPQMHTRMV